jgi:thymidylate kinase
MIVVFEGIDGVGKTTVATRVANRLGVPALATPPPDLRLVATKLLCDVRSPARYLYYLAAVVRLSEQLTDLAVDMVVIDRYVDSVHAMHAPHHPEFAAALPAMPIVQPDVVFLLEADERVRRQRLADRTAPALDPFEKSLLDDDFRLRVTTEYHRRDDLTVIDTTTLSVDEVVDRCISEIHKISSNHLKTAKYPR